MIKSKYHQVLVGKNYVSLLFAILNAPKNDVLLIDEPEVKLGDKWYRNIGMLEKCLLQKIGEIYNIDAFKNIDLYTKPTNTFICLDDKYIELGSAPLANIRELARKLPELFTADFIDSLASDSYKTFDKECMDFFEKVVAKSLSERGLNESIFHINEASQIESVFNHFQTIINNSQALMTKQLHFVLQVLFQTVFSNSKNDLETNFLLSAILSPRFILDEKKLNEDLSFNLKQLGADMITNRIQDWEIYQQQLKFILLESYHGIVELDELFIFGRLPHKFPFQRRNPQTHYMAIDVQVPVDHGFVDQYKNKRILFSRSERLGSSSPHWEAFIDSDAILRGTYCYADFQGTKASFHYKKAAEELFNSVSRLLPGLVKDDWMHQIKFQQSDDVWMEILSEKSSTPGKFTKEDSLVVDRDHFKSIGKIKYWGPLRAQSLGIFGHLVNLTQLDSFSVGNNG